MKERFKYNATVKNSIAKELSSGNLFITVTGFWWPMHYEYDSLKMHSSTEKIQELVLEGS